MPPCCVRNRQAGEAEEEHHNVVLLHCQRHSQAGEVEGDQDEGNMHRVHVVLQAAVIAAAPVCSLGPRPLDCKHMPTSVKTCHLSDAASAVMCVSMQIGPHQLD